MSATDALIPIAVIAGLALILWAHPPSAGAVTGSKPVRETFPSFDLIRRDGEAFGTFKVFDNAGAPVAELGLGADGRLYQSDAQREATRGRVEFTPVFALLDTSGLDLGTWAGYWNHDPGASGDSSFQPGLRWSPIRAIEWISLDAVASADAGGVGFSVFPPRRIAGQFHHIGLGAWALAPWSGGDPGYAFGLSFTTK